MTTDPTDYEIREAVEELCAAMPEIFSEHPGTPGNPDEIYSIGGFWWFNDDATPRGALPIIADLALAKLAKEEWWIPPCSPETVWLHRDSRAWTMDHRYDLSIPGSRALAEIRACTEAARMMEE